MQARFITYKNSRICWHRFGTGPQPVICFHGYGESGINFSFLDNLAGQHFSFLAIDLPFHGSTEWNEGLDFGCEDLLGIILLLLHQIDNTTRAKNDKLILLGFSLGGRVALSLYQAIPERITRVVLLAPDGLKMNFWYWLSTQTWIGNKLFSFTMQYPGWFFGTLRAFQALRIVNASVLKFVKYYVDNKHVRHELYNRWTALRKLKPDLGEIKSLIKQYKTPVRLVYGLHDRIILSGVGERFRKGIENNCMIIIIESGHQVLHAKHEVEIVKQLYE